MSQPERSDPAVTPEGRRYLLPISNLTLTREWEVGCVRFLPKGATRSHVAATESPDVNWPTAFEEHRENVIARFDDSTAAEVDCAEPREAYERVSDALAVLRLLQHTQDPRVDTDWQTFGLPGQVSQWTVEYIDLTTGPRIGFFRGGALPGWAFSDDDYDAFQADEGLQFLSRALASDDRTRLEQRAILAARLLSTSTLEPDPDQKLLAAMTAVEVLLGGDAGGPKKFRLAQRHAFLTCLIPAGDMCGRDRKSCHYLALDLDIRVQRDELIALIERARSDPRVRCTMYLDMIDLYNARNRAVHDGTAGSDLDAIKETLYPVFRWMVPQALRWYAAHNDGGLQQINDEIAHVVSERPPDPMPSDGS